MKSFLPTGFEKLRIEKPYWKMSQMKDGDNRLRIVQRPIAGWIQWHENKPLRYRPDQKPKRPLDAAKPLRPFWACYVWDYAREGLYVLEITQASVLKSLTAYAEDPDWGDFTQYDLKIRREGSGKETRYQVTPLPHKAMSSAIEAALSCTPVYLENLYDGGDPWDESGAKPFDAGPEAPVRSKLVSVEPANDRLTLIAQISESGVDVTYLDEYVATLAEKKQESPDRIIEAALQPSIFPKFLVHYAKELERRMLSPETAA